MVDPVLRVELLDPLLDLRSEARGLVPGLDELSTTAACLAFYRPYLPVELPRQGDLSSPSAAHLASMLSIRAHSPSSGLRNLRRLPVRVQSFSGLGHLALSTLYHIASVHIAKVDRAIRSMFSGYSSEMGDEIATSTQSNANTTSGRVRSWSDWSSHISSRSSQVTGELDRYLRDDLFPCDDENFDILYWWKMHAAKYPTIARMARDMLAAPASTVAWESAFSTGGRIISDHRTRLSGNNVETLICFQDGLRTTGPSYLDIIKIDSTGSSVDELGPAA